MNLYINFFKYINIYYNFFYIFFYITPSNLFYKPNNNKIQRQYKSHKIFF